VLDQRYELVVQFESYLGDLGRVEAAEPRRHGISAATTEQRALVSSGALIEPVREIP